MLTAEQGSDRSLVVAFSSGPLDPRAADELCTLWWLLESDALKHAKPTRLTDRGVRRSLRAAVQLGVHPRHENDGDAWLAMHRDVHALVGSLADNPHLSSALDDVLLELGPHLRASEVHRSELFRRSTTATAKALLRRDLVRCLASVTLHTVHVRAELTGVVSSPLRPAAGADVARRCSSDATPQHGAGPDDAPTGQAP